MPASFRLQGLVTLLAACSRPNRVGLVSCRQRSWDSPFGAFSSGRGADAFPRLRTHLPFLPPGYSRRTRRRAGPGGRGFWGLTLAGVPRTVRVISPHDAGGSHGLFPSRVCGKNPGRASPAASFALCSRFASEPSAGALESSDVCLVPAAHVSRNSGRDNPRRVSPPVRSAAFERWSRRAMCSPARRAARHRRPTDAL